MQQIDVIFMEDDLVSVDIHDKFEELPHVQI